MIATSASSGMLRSTFDDFAVGETSTDFLERVIERPRPGSARSTVGHIKATIGEISFTGIGENEIFEGAVGGTNSSPVFVEALADAVKSLERFASLEEGWDSYGAPAITSDAIVTAFDILEHLQDHLPGGEIAPYAVAPVATGGIQLEWRGRAGELEIEIGSMGEISSLLVTKRGSSRQFQERDGLSFSDVVQVVRKVVI